MFGKLKFKGVDKKRISDQEHIDDYNAAESPRQHVGGEVDDKINTRKPHEHREYVRKPAHALVAYHKDCCHRSEGGCRMPGGEALVTFHILPDKQPELIENAAFIGVWARSGYQNLQNAVCKQCADGDAEEHCRAEAAGQTLSRRLRRLVV